MKCLVVMDAIDALNTAKDTTFALMLEAKRRTWDVHYCESSSLFIKDQTVFASNAPVLSLTDQATDYYQLGEAMVSSLQDFDIVLMRKDPPFNMEYIYVTYLLELAEKSGVKVVNKPQSLRDANEKLFTTQFPACCPVMIVTANMQQIHAFIDEQSEVVCKLLGGMGGESIFRVSHNDLNRGVIVETMTQYGARMIMVQRYIPSILEEGDKRVLLLNGEPVPFAFARKPAKGEFRGNIAAGGTGIVMPLTDKEQWICEQVGPTLREKGLLLVGLDIIGGYLTEINVTSPTCVRQIEAATGEKVCKQFLDLLE